MTLKARLLKLWYVMPLFLIVKINYHYPLIFSSVHWSFFKILFGKSSWRKHRQRICALIFVWSWARHLIPLTVGIKPFVENPFWVGLKWDKGNKGLKWRMKDFMSQTTYHHRTARVVRSLFFVACSCQVHPEGCCSLLWHDHVSPTSGNLSSEISLTE